MNDRENVKMSGRAEVICSNCGKRYTAESYRFSEPCRLCGYKRTELLRWL